MAWALLATGVALLVVVAYDFVATTLSVTVVRGGIAATVTQVVHALTQRLPSRWGLAAGPGAIIAVLLAWTVLAAAGWAAVLSVPLGTAETLPGIVERLRASMAVLSSGATGEMQVTGTWWPAVLQVMRLYGLGLLSLSLAWVLPVISAVVDRRAIAVRIAVLGADAEAIAARAGEEGQQTDLHLYLQSIAEALLRLAEQHRAYPVLHNFHTRQPDRAFGVATARLSRAVALLEDRGTVDTVTLGFVEGALDHVVDSFDAFLPGHDADDDERHEGEDGRSARRRRREHVLHQVVEHEGWSWDDVGADTAAPR